MTRTSRLRRCALLLAALLTAAACAGDVGDLDRGVVAADGTSGEVAAGGDGVAPSGPSAGSPLGAGDGEAVDSGGGTATQAGSAPTAASSSGTPSSPGAPPTPTGPYAGEVGVTDTAIRLTWFQPKSGAYTALGRNLPYAVNAALGQVNEQGGIHGRKVEVVYRDSGYNQASIAQTSAKAAKDDSFGFLTIEQPTGTVVGPLADQYRVPMVSLTMDEATALGLRYNFTAYPFYEFQMRELMAGFVKNHLKLGDKKIGVIYAAGVAFRKPAEAFRAAAATAGLDVVAFQPVEETPSTCANEVANVQAKDAEVVVLITGVVAAICVFRDARTIGFSPTWTGGGGFWNFNVTNAATGGATDGIQTMAITRTLETPEGRRYVEMLRKYNEDLPPDAEEDDIMSNAYAGTLLFLEGLRRAGPNLTRDGFVAAMETVQGFELGLGPPVSYGPGQRRGSTVAAVAKAVDGKWTTVAPQWRTAF